MPFEQRGSNKNLQKQLTTKNKTRLPKNSFPGIYRVHCSCGIAPYMGETKMKVSTRNVQHQECLRKKNWENSAVALHAQNCQGSIDFEKTKTV